MAYLVMMTPRLSALHRVMKPIREPSTCTVIRPPSHYLKLLMDAVFGPNNFSMRSSGSDATGEQVNGRFMMVSPRQATT